MYDNIINVIMDNHYDYYIADCDKYIPLGEMSWQDRDKIRAASNREEKEQKRKKLIELGIEYL